MTLPQSARIPEPEGFPRPFPAPTLTGAIARSAEQDYHVLCLGRCQVHAGYFLVPGRLQVSPTISRLVVETLPKSYLDSTSAWRASLLGDWCLVGCSDG